MPQLFGRDFTRRELEAFGALEQYAGIRRFTGNDGFEAGVELIEVRTGGGLRFVVAPSRGLDIVAAEFRGINLSWWHPNGVIHPAYYGADNFDWLRGGPCGLVSTCGLNSFGPPCEEGGEKYSLHDRISYTPAREVAAQTLWRDDRTCDLQIRGTLRQTRLFGANIRLERTLTARLGENRIELRDEITNDGFVSAPVAVLYHCNFGFPLLGPGARVEIPSQSMEPRDAIAAQGVLLFILTTTTIQKWQINMASKIH